MSLHSRSFVSYSEDGKSVRVGYRGDTRELTANKEIIRDNYVEVVSNEEAVDVRGLFSINVSLKEAQRWGVAAS